MFLLFKIPIDPRLSNQVKIRMRLVVEGFLNISTSVKKVGYEQIRIMFLNFFSNE